MALPISFYSVTVNDNTVKANGMPESSNMRVPITTLTPANVAATATLCGNLLTALVAVTIGQVAKHTMLYDETIVSADPAASQLAQREKKWLLRYHDATTGKKFSVSYPCADLTKLPNHEEFLDLADAGVGAALKTAFEAVVVSPDDPSHSVVLDSVQYVGRNS